MVLYDVTSPESCVKSQRTREEDMPACIREVFRYLRESGAITLSRSDGSLALLLGRGGLQRRCRPGCYLATVANLDPSEAPCPWGLGRPSERVVPGTSTPPTVKV